MTSYKDNPLNIKEIQFRLNKCADIIRVLQDRNDVENTEYEEIKTQTDKYINNEVILMFDNSLFIKQYIINPKEDGSIFKTYKHDKYDSAQIVAGIDRVLLLLLVKYDNKYYIAFNEGVYYADVLKWGSFQLLSVDSSALELATATDTETAFKCVYNQYLNSFYLVCSVNGSGSPSIPLMKLLEYKSSTADGNGSWSWNTIALSGLSSLSDLSGLYYDISIINFDENSKMYNKYPNGGLVCSGYTSSDKFLISQIGLLEYNKETRSITSQKWEKLSCETDTLYAPQHVKYYSISQSIVQTSTVEDSEIETSSCVLATVGHTLNTTNIPYILQTGKAYALVNFKLTTSGSTETIEIKIDIKWQNITLPKIDEEHFNKYLWKTITYDKDHNEFIMGYDFYKDNDKVDKTNLNHKMVTLNVSPSINDDNSTVSFSISYTIDKEYDYINSMCLLFDVNRDEIMAATTNPDNVVKTKIRNNNQWNDKGCYSNIKTESIPISLSSCKESENRVYMLTVKTDGDRYYVYILSYDISRDWVDDIDNYYTIKTK